MQQLVRMDQRTSPAQGMSLPGSGMALLALLDEAREAAREGDLMGARVICAEAMFRHQMLLSEDPSLLAAMIAAMVHARGFQMISRLMAAVDGTKIRIVVEAGGKSRSAATRVDADGVIHASVGETFLAQEAAIAQWSAELAGLHKPGLSRPAS